MSAPAPLALALAFAGRSLRRACGRGTSVRVLALLSCGALALSGCIQAASVKPASVSDLASKAATPLSAFRGLDTVALPADYAGLKVRASPTGFNGGEPSIGVTKDGSIFTVLKGDTLPTKDVLATSSDHGASWKILSDIKNGPVSLDPWMHVDPITDRLWNTPLYVACTWAAWSDDHGKSWDANPIAGCGVPAHDHQKLTTGAPAKGVQTTGYPDVVYYSYNSFRKEGTWISESYDGGKTFNLGQVVHAQSCHAGIASPVAVAPDGTAYSAKPTCDGLDIAVSKDSGKSWKVTGHVNDVGSYQALATTVDIATDTQNNAYAAFGAKDGLIYLTTSHDGGASWSAPVRVSPPDVTVTTFSNLAAGAPGHVAIGYLGTRADASKWEQKTGEKAASDAVWQAFLTFSDDALAGANATFVSQQVTPNDDPVQIGCIWLSGGSNACRNLGDFIDVTMGNDGRAYFVYTDGCNKCTTDATSHGRSVVVALVDSGPSLLGGRLPDIMAGMDHAKHQDADAGSDAGPVARALRLSSP